MRIPTLRMQARISPGIDSSSSTASPKRISDARSLTQPGTTSVPVPIALEDPLSGVTRKSISLALELDWSEYRLAKRSASRRAGASTSSGSASTSMASSSSVSSSAPGTKTPPTKHPSVRIRSTS